MPLVRPRRTVDEIVQLHVREGRRVQEVYVEGREDQVFYSHFLIERGLADVAVLLIDSVEITPAAVEQFGLLIGNKGRVIALAALLENRVQINEVVCIADADLDHFTGKDTNTLCFSLRTTLLLSFMPSMHQRSRRYCAWDSAGSQRVQTGFCKTLKTYWSPHFSSESRHKP